MNAPPCFRPTDAAIESIPKMYMALKAAQEYWRTPKDLLDPQSPLFNRAKYEALIANGGPWTKVDEAIAACEGAL